MIPMSLLSFGLKNWKYILIVLTLLSAGFYAAWQIQGIRVEKLKLEASRLQADVAVCQEANKINQETIGKLKKELADAAKVCAKRLKINDRKADRIRQIDEIKPYEFQVANKYGGKNEKVDVYVVTSDTLLNELNRMFNDPATGSKDGIHKTDSTRTADPAAILSCQMAGSGHTETVRLYCLDSENAKNLLKNREIDKAYSDELIAILEGL